MASRQDGSRVRCTGPNSWETLSFFGGKREMSEDNFDSKEDMMIEDEMVAFPQKRAILRKRKYSLV